MTATSYGCKIVQQQITTQIYVSFINVFCVICNCCEHWMLVSDDDMMIHRIYIYIFHAHFTAHEIPLLVGLWVWFVLAMSVYENGNKLYNIVIVSIYPMILPLTYNKLTKSKCVYSSNDWAMKISAHTININI